MSQETIITGLRSFAESDKEEIARIYEDVDFKDPVYINIKKQITHQKILALRNDENLFD